MASPEARGIVLTDKDAKAPVTATSKCPTCGAGPDKRVEKCGFGPERPIMCTVCCTVLQVKRI